jgi:NhaP-type Na+/H+ or K+/H+ antiporter
MAIGIASGMFAALLLKFALLGRKDNGEDHYHFNVPEIGTAFAAAYLPFIIASSIEGQSGIVAVLFAGITMRHYAHYNLTQASRNLFLPTVELFATLAENYAFIILGLGVFLLRNAFSASVICWTIVGCLVGRFMNVYPLSSMVNCCSKSKKMKVKEMHVVWFAGLRGAIAFMCAMRFPDTNKHRDLFLSTTMVITFLSMVFLGWPTASLLRCLDLKGDVPAIDEENAENNEQPVETPKTRLIGLTETGCAVKVSDFFKWVLMTQEAREERTSRVSEARLMRTSMSRMSAAKGLGHQRVSPLGPGDRPSAAERVSNAAPGNRTSNALSQARSSAASNGSRSFRTLCNP